MAGVGASAPGGVGGNPGGGGSDGASGSENQEPQFSEADPESLAMQVADWVWGVIEGGFNEKQTTSQIIVDAAITLIPVVGDIAVVRDLLACVVRMVNDPAKRSSKLEWLQLRILRFALLPVAGGVIKGVARLLLCD